MIIKSYAKINLALNIVKKREDGYHDLDMIMIPLELHDAIEISMLPNTFESFITCDDFALEVNQYNLCSIVLKKLKEKFNVDKSFRIHIHKNIPIGAGLGGGSSNAAAIINAFKKILKIKMSKEEEIELAKSVGADVPFFLETKASRVKGIGEILETIKIKNTQYVLIVKPKKSLSTKVVYEKYDVVGSNGKANIDRTLEMLEKGEEEDLYKVMNNELEKAAIELLPEIQHIKNMLKESGLKNVMMSGSGSAVFAISSNKSYIEKEYKELERQGYDVYLTKTL